MLKSLELSNFTVFKNEAFVFSPGLNVVIGENGVGKTHVLKTGYVVAGVLFGTNKGLFAEGKTTQKLLCEKILDTFLVSSVGKLTTRSTKVLKTSVQALVGEPESKANINFLSDGVRELSYSVEGSDTVEQKAIFMPADPSICFSPTFQSLFRTRHVCVSRIL